MAPPTACSEATGDDTYIVTNSSRLGGRGPRPCPGSGSTPCSQALATRWKADFGAGVEKLVLTGGEQYHTGPAINSGNILIGNSGANSLRVWKADDLFVAMPGMGADRVTDFVAGVDTDDRVDVSAFPVPSHFGGRAGAGDAAGCAHRHRFRQRRHAHALLESTPAIRTSSRKISDLWGTTRPQAGTALVVTNEDTPYVFVAADFRFSDLGDAQPTRSRACVFRACRRRGC